jgi:hypothetical protein
MLPVIATGEATLPPVPQLLFPAPIVPVTFAAIALPPNTTSPRQSEEKNVLKRIAPPYSWFFSSR